MQYIWEKSSQFYLYRPIVQTADFPLGFSCTRARTHTHTVQEREETSKEQQKRNSWHAINVWISGQSMDLVSLHTCGAFLLFFLGVTLKLISAAMCGSGISWRRWHWHLSCFNIHCALSFYWVSANSLKRLAFFIENVSLSLHVVEYRAVFEL